MQMRGEETQAAGVGAKEFRQHRRARRLVMSIGGLEADRGQPLAIGDLRRGAQAESEVGILLHEGLIQSLDLSLELGVQILGFLKGQRILVSDGLRCEIGKCCRER